MFIVQIRFIQIVDIKVMRETYVDQYNVLCIAGGMALHYKDAPDHAILHVSFLPPKSKMKENQPHTYVSLTVAICKEFKTIPDVDYDTPKFPEIDNPNKEGRNNQSSRRFEG